MQAMMDSYIIQQRLMDAWRNLAVMPSGASTKPAFPQVPLYVNIGDKQVVVTDIKEIDGKIILETTDVDSTI